LILVNRIIFGAYTPSAGAKQKMLESQITFSILGQITWVRTFKIS